MKSVMISDLTPTEYTTAPQGAFLYNIAPTLEPSLIATRGEVKLRVPLKGSHSFIPDFLDTWDGPIIGLRFVGETDFEVDPSAVFVAAGDKLQPGDLLWCETGVGIALGGNAQMRGTLTGTLVNPPIAYRRWRLRAENYRSEDSRYLFEHGFS